MKMNLVKTAVILAGCMLMAGSASAQDSYDYSDGMSGYGDLDTNPYTEDGSTSSNGVTTTVIKYDPTFSGAGTGDPIKCAALLLDMKTTLSDHAACPPGKDEAGVTCRNKAANKCLDVAKKARREKCDPQPDQDEEVLQCPKRERKPGSILHESGSPFE